MNSEIVNILNKFLKGEVKGEEPLPDMFTGSETSLFCFTSNKNFEMGATLNDFASPKPFLLPDSLNGRV
jgi:hypothetical protein